MVGCRGVGGLEGCWWVEGVLVGWRCWWVGRVLVGWGGVDGLEVLVGWRCWWVEGVLVG